MRFALVVLSALSLVSAEKVLYCAFASDNTGMEQKPYCCDSYQPHEHRKETLIGSGCGDPLTKPQGCKGYLKPTCCYTIGQEYICTSDAQLTDE
ncbi:hypothetical protein ASPZODRAFT_133596 [Penicilliopsis zonata CBS 506.65]|uniref:Hydrophobin n=1 Tax=Penicilliopsis zonata CBS 506.65 TaxID=1073090 RepID=A0A1L9SEW6_9EURO|nr:hypothetical protein ASPZODRAFT_133596 [Penicilliopsis zonata CBS 506.65]OJJ45731.1 hypothetical protein ASPZODRAFT_133596 [Penicilliopsis zonata CBS 506.65]